jgi:hypothetical protein
LRHVTPVIVTNKSNPRLSLLPPLRASYQWSYVGANNCDNSSGTLNIFINLTNSQITLDLMSFGKRVMSLRGNSIIGYGLLIPRYGINQNVTSLSMIPIPIFSNMSSPESLYQLLVNGSGNEVKIISQDIINGPIKLQYVGANESGSRVLICLKRIC